MEETVYKIKNVETGLYWNGRSWTKTGKIYRTLSTLKNGFRCLTGLSGYRQTYDQAAISDQAVGLVIEVFCMKSAIKLAPNSPQMLNKK